MNFRTVVSDVGINVESFDQQVLLNGIGHCMIEELLEYDLTGLSELIENRCRNFRAELASIVDAVEAVLHQAQT
jgi:hypothetical protein